MLPYSWSLQVSTGLPFTYWWLRYTHFLSQCFLWKFFIGNRNKHKLCRKYGHLSIAINARLSIRFISSSKIRPWCLYGKAYSCLFQAFKLFSRMHKSAAIWFCDPGCIKLFFPYAYCHAYIRYFYSFYTCFNFNSSKQCILWFLFPPENYLPGIYPMTVEVFHIASIIFFKGSIHLRWLFIFLELVISPVIIPVIFQISGN